jgi:hypothetical protein
MAVLRKGRGPRRANRRTEAGLGVRAQRAAARPTRDVGAAVALWSATSQNQFSLTRFDRIFLQNVELYWTKG